MTWLLLAWLLLGLTNLAGLARAYHRPQPPRHRLRRPGGAQWAIHRGGPWWAWLTARSESGSARASRAH